MNGFIWTLYMIANVIGLSSFIVLATFNYLKRRTILSNWAIQVIIVTLVINLVMAVFVLYITRG